MSKIVCLQYPCGKLIELKMPIMISIKNEKPLYILPGANDFMMYAKQKFEFNGLKVVEIEIETKTTTIVRDFISIHDKKYAIE